MSDDYIIIANEGDDGELNYWNNDTGWSDFLESASRFSKSQMETIVKFNCLPCGKNVKMVKSDSIDEQVNI